MGEIIAGILAAVLAAFGFYSLLRTVGELLRPPCPVTTAVLIRTRQELADLDLFLDEARHGARRRGTHLHARKPQHEETRQRKQQNQNRIFHRRSFFRTVTTSFPAGSGRRCCGCCGRY